MKKKISIYVRNKKITPSSYYRIIQYSVFFDGDIKIRENSPSKIYKKQLNSQSLNFFRRILVGVFYYIILVVRTSFSLCKDLIWKPDYVIVSKSFCPKHTPAFLNFLIKKLVETTTVYWDYDDNIFLNKEISKKQAKILMKYSNKIIVTNDFLKGFIDDKYKDKVILMPTTDGDLQGFNSTELKKSRKSALKKEVRIVWVGTSSNLKNFDIIINELEKVAELVQEQYKKRTILTIVCNAKLIKKTNFLEIRNIEWDREVSKKEIYAAHIGIMPLIQNNYSLGKGGFKLVQYISTGLPVVGSGVGYNNEVIDLNCGYIVDDNLTSIHWIDAILKIIESPLIWETYSDAAYSRWKQKFSFETNLLSWKELLSRNEV
ncbi:glycosyltransferase [Carnobacterium sp. FSL E2-0243]|uniref:glycosyltransferase n=1 Tax=Carnobacterium sp. FSL E2-0243 TaxID=2921365 RepID=UPI0030F5AE8F